MKYWLCIQNKRDLIDVILFFRLIKLRDVFQIFYCNTQINFK